MRYKGKIKELDHIVISDPTYDESVTCRYERTNLNEENWLVDIDIKPVVDKIKDFTINGTEFFLFMCKDKKLAELRENGTITYLRGIEIEETEIGMDTACVAIGIDENAEEIIELRDEWQPECSLNTTTDGLFGTVKEGKIEDEPVFIWLSGYLSEYAGYSIEEIIDYLKHQLNITELQKDITKSTIIKQENILEKIVELKLKFREITKEDPKLLEIFNGNDRFSNIEFACTYLAGMDLINKERENGNLDGEIEKSPYSKEQEKMIQEYKELINENEFEKAEKEFENDKDI